MIGWLFLLWLDHLNLITSLCKYYYHFYYLFYNHLFSSTTQIKFWFCRVRKSSTLVFTLYQSYAIFIWFSKCLQYRFVGNILVFLERYFLSNPRHKHHKFHLPHLKPPPPPPPPYIAITRSKQLATKNPELQPSNPPMSTQITSNTTTTWVTSKPLLAALITSRS